MQKDDLPNPGEGSSIFAFSERALREARLRDAIEHGRIDVLFQPQVAAANGAVIGAEALARWNDAHFGEVGANALFTMARSAGLLPDLSRHVAQVALQMARNWPDHLRLSINVTPSELRDAQFEAHLARMIGDAGFPVSRLVLEITEDEPVQDLATCAQIMARLRKGGIRIALDDFGAGCSNLNYLKQLPLDAIKLDRSIIMGIGENRRDLVMLRAVMMIAEAFELDVVAEGIETAVERRVATAEGCDYLQGFAIAQPCSMDQFLKFAAV